MSAADQRTKRPEEAIVSGPHRATADGDTQTIPGIPVRRLWASLALTLIVLLTIAWFMHEPGTWAQIIKYFNPIYLAAAAGILILRAFIGGFRIRYASHNHLSYPVSIRGQLMWDFTSYVTPSIIGGGPITALMIARDARLPVGEVVSIMLFAMLMDQIWFAFAVASLIVASVFMNVYPDAVGNVGEGFFTVFFVGMLAWTLLFAYSTLVRPELLQRLVRRLFKVKWLKRFRHRVDAELEGWRDRARVFRSEGVRFYVFGVLLAGMSWTCRYLVLLFIALAVYPLLDQLVFVARTVAMLHLALIMPTPGGSGGIEAMFALFFTPLLPRGLVAPPLIVWRFLAYYVPIAAGFAVASHVFSRRRLSNRKHVVEPAEYDPT